MSKRNVHSSKLYEKYWIVAIIILLIPFIGLFDLLSTPKNLVIGIIAEVLFIVYLSVKIIKMYSHEEM